MFFSKGQLPLLTPTDTLQRYKQSYISVGRDLLSGDQSI